MSKSSTVKKDLMDEAPKELNVIQLTQSHAKEIRALTQAVKDVDKLRNTAQALPRHMRRRAASHNLNRLPRRIKEQIKQKAERSDKIEIPPPKKKPPSRFYRRRPKNALEEFTKRQKGTRWLETHVWHAKRFHMIEKWGHKLPVHPCDKSVRAGYRAAREHCLMQDVSYIHGIELSGNRIFLSQNLSTLIPLNKDEILTDSDITHGRKFLSCLMYTPGSFPYGALAQVQIMYHSNTSSNDCKIWIWCHISTYKIVWEQVCTTFNDGVMSADNGTYQPVDTGDGVKITSLRDQLIRFRLIGQQTGMVLKRVLFPARLQSGDESKSWWCDIYTDIVQANKQFQATLNIAFTGKSGENSISHATVKDPRLCMPSIHKSSRGLISDRQMETVDSEILNRNACWLSSALWDESLRLAVTASKTSDHKINSKRSELLIPGCELSLGSDENAVPIIMLRNPGCFSTDIILPTGWGRPFWMAFIYAQARPGGLRENYKVSSEREELCFPFDFPDTKACQAEENEEEKLLAEKYLKYPPAKRPNYDKLGVNSPFSYDWTQVFGEECHPAVLRNKERLKHIQSLVLGDISASNLVSFTDQFLVAVKLTMVNRGVPEERSLVTVPSADDNVNMNALDKNYGVTEQLHAVKDSKRDSCHRTTIQIPQSRQLIGFVRHGLFSPSSGHGRGLAFLSVEAIVSTVRNSPHLVTKNRSGLLVMVRPTDSRQHRFAYATIHIPI